ncbi:MAG: sulfatase-like hydrolase/transferase [Planctomycetota bacterium]
MKRTILLIMIGTFLVPGAQVVQGAKIVHDAEYYILEAQNGEKWAAEDKAIDKKLAELRRKYKNPPNIVYILWDDTAFGCVGFPGLQKNFGYETPQINRMAEEGILFTRMYSEPACTPTRAAALTGRHPVRNGMGVVGMPHEFGGLHANEVTIAEVLSEAGYATAHFGKVHRAMLSTLFSASIRRSTRRIRIDSIDRACCPKAGLWSLRARKASQVVSGVSPHLSGTTNSTQNARNAPWSLSERMPRRANPSSSSTGPTL